MTEHTTELRGLSLPRRLWNTLQNDDRLRPGVIAFLGGTLTAMGHITGEIAPFGVAFAAAAPAAVTVPALLGTALGYLLTAESPVAWQYPLAALLAVAVKRLLAVIARRVRPWHGVMGVLLGLTAAVIVPGAYRHPLVYDVLLWGTFLLMGGAAAVFLQRGLGLLQPGRQTPKERTLSASLAVAAALCLMGLCSITLSGVSMGRVAASVLLLTAAAGAGSRAGALVGVISGLVVGFSTGEFTLSVTCFAVGGLLCGLFAPLGRWGSVLALAISYGFFAMLASRSVAGFLEVLLAAGIFWILPGAAPRRLGQLISPAKEQTPAPTVLADRLETAAEALREVAATTREVASRLQKSTAESPEALFDRMAERHCRGCLYQMACWQKNYGGTVGALGRGLTAYRKTGHIPPEALDGLNDRCPNRERLAAALEREYAGYLSREEQRQHTARVRSIVTDQFDGLAGTLTDLSERSCGITPCTEGLTRRITEGLLAAERELREVLCWTSSGGHLTVRLAFPAALPQRVDAEKLGKLIAAEAGLEMEGPTRSRQEGVLLLTYREKPRYRLEHWQYQLPAVENTPCGDTLRDVRGEEGLQALILSDGMGTGAAAALDSAMLCNLVGRLLEAGIPCGSALRLVNSALMVKGGRETLATLDAAAVDCYTGSASFYKAGAAPTFLRRQGRAMRLEAVSLPAGILDGVEPVKRRFALREEDLLLMVSDGVPTEEPWVEEQLTAWEGDDPAELCRRIAEAARLRCREVRPDDITVAALQLVRQ